MKKALKYAQEQCQRGMREQKTESVDYPGQYMDDAMVDFQSRPRRDLSSS